MNNLTPYELWQLDAYGDILPTETNCLECTQPDLFTNWFERESQLSEIETPF